jgi:hypothetical protein
MAPGRSAGSRDTPPGSRRSGMAPGRFANRFSPWLRSPAVNNRVLAMMRLGGRHGWQDHHCQNEKEQQDALSHFRLFRV